MAVRHADVAPARHRRSRPRLRAAALRRGTASRDRPHSERSRGMSRRLDGGSTGSGGGGLAGTGAGMSPNELDGRIGEGWGGIKPNGSHVNVVLARRGGATFAAAIG